MVQIGSLKGEKLEKGIITPAKDAEKTNLSLA
jgi:hypothetical protein